MLNLQKKNQKNQKENYLNQQGWRILVLPFKQKEKTKGGINILADETVERSQVASTCGLF